MGGPACLVIDAPPGQAAELEHVLLAVVAQLARWKIDIVATSQTA